MNPRNFFAELKRRNVYKVAVAYAVVAWLLIQAASILFPTFEAPAWVMKVVIATIALGFPVALILAWAFELTPEGIKRTEAVHPHEPVARRTGRGLNFFVIFVLAAAVGVLLYQKWRAPDAKPAASSVEKSIAVLPFENLSSDKENAYFTDGVQDEILTDLAKIADLKVISRTSVMQYKTGVARNLREIGQQLGVALLVEGSVQRAGNKVRVNAQLIDARTEGHLWAQVYDRPLDDVFAIQSEIAQTIADQLQTKVSPAEKAAIAERPTSNLRAYELYTEANELLSVYISAKNSNETVLRAVDLLNQAVALDPSFHLAYCRLAQAHENVWFYQIDRTPARIALAKGAVDAAVRLRPDSGETHLAQAYFVYFIPRDFETAARELAIALRTLPNNSDAIFLSGLIARRTGRWEEALAFERRAQLIDPRNLDIVRSVADILFSMPRYAEDEKTLHHDLETVPESAAIIYAKLTECMLAAGDLPKAKEYCALIPPDWNTHGYGSFYRWLTALYTHDFAAAMTIAQSAPEPMPESLNGGQMQNAKGYFVGQVARAQNNENLARTAFAEARPEAEKRSSGEDGQAPFFVAILARVDAALGNKEAAIAEARRAVELRPISKDAAQGPDLETSFAVVYAWTGERDLAFQHLEHVTQTPAGASYGDLKFNPRWDSLRNDPRFEKILAGLVPKR